MTNTDRDWMKTLRAISPRLSGASSETSRVLLPLRAVLERAADTDLPDCVRVQLPIGKLAKNGQLHVALQVDAFADQDCYTGREIEPVAATDEHRRTVECILLPVKPVNPPKCHHAMGLDDVGPAGAKLRGHSYA